MLWKFDDGDEVEYGKLDCYFAGASGESGAAILENCAGSAVAGRGGLRGEAAGSERGKICEGASLDVSEYRVCAVGDSAGPGDFQYGGSAGGFSRRCGHVRVLAEGRDCAAGRAIFAGRRAETGWNQPGAGGH